VVDAVVDRIPAWAGALAAVGLFLLAVRLLGTGTAALAPALAPILRRTVVSDPSALGLAWLASYLLGNGSVVAALSLSLFASALVSPSELYLMVAGSRLGAAGIVFLVGVLDFVQKREFSLPESTALGVLVFLLTYTIVLPATVLGYLGVEWVQTLSPGGATVPDFGVPSLQVTRTIAAGLASVLPGPVVLLVALVLLVASLNLFDRSFAKLDTRWLREHVFVHLERPGLSFAAGFLVTGVSTSVAFSLGVLVPLYNRGYVTRAELVPFVLGANVSTLVDTLLVAFVLGTVTGLELVGLLTAVSFGLTVAVLLVYDPYYRFVDATMDRILGNRAVFASFLAALVLVPVVLVLVGHAT
jgi:sodium-dependent phosphate cotransporter